MLSTVAVVINSELDTLGDREGSRVTLRLIQETPQQAVLLDKICRGGGARAHPPITMAYGTLQSRGLARSEPERRMGLLYRLGFHRDVLELPEGAGHLGSGLRPQRFHDLYSLDKATHALSAGEPKNGLRHVSSDANTDSKPSLAELVQARDEFGELHGIAQNRQHDRCAQAQARGERRGIGEEAEGFQHGHRANDRLLHPQAIVA